MKVQGHTAHQWDERRAIALIEAAPERGHGDPLTEQMADALWAAVCRIADLKDDLGEARMGSDW